MYYAIVKKNKLEFFSKNRDELVKYCENNSVSQDKIKELSEGSIEGCWDGNCYIKGYAPAKPEPTYIELRKAEYPAIEDQLDMIYWDKINGTSTWQDKITEIKEKYPKV